MGPTMRTQLISSLLFVPLTAALGGLAHAGEDPPPALTAAPTAAEGIAGDPNVDRGFLLPTAMTQPKGSVTYNNYELLIHGLTYGITDHTQVSFGVLAPVVKEMPFVGTASLKTRVVDAGRFHLALQASATLAGSDLGLLGAGVLGSYCLSDDCASLLNASAGYQFGAPFSQDFQNGHLVTYGAGLIQRLGDHVKLLVEVGSAMSATNEGDASNGVDHLPGLVLNYGVRFHGSKLAADVGFIRPIVDGIDDPFILGIPFLNVSYRW
jgi:hypothetical protein